MKINGIHHIGINTSDFQKSVDFYTKVLKLDFLEEADLGGDYAAYVRCGDHSVIELFRMDQTCSDHTHEEACVGIRHIAFDVDDVKEWNRYLKELKVPYEAELMNIEAIRKKVLLIQGPDHVIIELSEGY